MGSNVFSTSAITSFRKAFSNKTLKKHLIFRVNPFHDLTKKPQEVRMGKGRGTRIQKTISPIIPGQVLLEIDVAKRARRARFARRALQIATRKFPFRTRICNMDL
jgi:ribosomal protein L16/L10AE